MKGFILAAGFGTRLWPLTEDRSKPAIPFNNRPLITYSVEYLASHGIRDLIINLHHQPESIVHILGDGSRFGVRIEYSREEEILGTSGALDRAREKLSDGDFVVINGKIVTDIDLAAAIDNHRRHQALATLVLRENTSRERFSIVETDDRGWITRFGSFPEPASESPAAKPAIVSDSPPLLFTGIQVVSPRIFDYVPRGRFSHSTVDVYPRAIEAGEPVIAHVTQGSWHEVSTLKRYFDANHEWLRREGRPYFAGKNCAVSDNAVVEDSVLWDSVTIEPNAVVRFSVLADGVRIRSSVAIERSVVVRRELVREVERGAIIDDNIVVPI